MAKIRHILQGVDYDENTRIVLSDIINKNKDNIDYAIFNTAFLTKDGVALLYNELKEIYDKVTFYVGIGNNVTTIQGLQSLLDIGVDLYVVDVARGGTIYHPKDYLIKVGDTIYSLIGSANFTRGGLISNIESNLLLEMDYTKNDSKEYVEALREHYQLLSHGNEDNVFKVSTHEEIISLFREGNLIDEEVERSRKDKEIQEDKDNKPSTGEKRQSMKLQIESFSISGVEELEKYEEVEEYEGIEDAIVAEGEWHFGNYSKILIAEIPKNGDRTKQVNFSKRVFSEYFGNEGISSTIKFKCIYDDSEGNVECRSPVSVASHNYRYELDGAVRKKYPVEYRIRPIGLFVNTGNEQFLYSILFPGDKKYDDINNYLDSRKKEQII